MSFICHCSNVLSLISDVIKSCLDDKDLSVQLHGAKVTWSACSVCDWHVALVDRSMMLIECLCGCNPHASRHAHKDTFVVVQLLDEVGSVTSHKLQDVSSDNTSEVPIDQVYNYIES